MKRSLLSGLVLGLAASYSGAQSMAPAYTPATAYPPAYTTSSVSSTAPGLAARDDDAPFVELEADYLYWWCKKAGFSAPALSTGDPNATVPGRIGNPAARILIGGGDAPLNGQSGLRLGATYILEKDSGLGINLGGFFLGRSSTTTAFSSNAAGLPPLAQPAINGLTGQSATYAIADAQLGLAGAFSSSYRLSLFGWEANAVTNLMDDGDGFRVRGLAGFRHIGLRETYSELAFTQNLPGANVLSLGGINNPVNSLTTQDTFRGFTDFYGAQIGTTIGYQCGALGIDVTGKVGLGVSQQRIIIDGVSVGPNGQSFVGGIRAASSNIGSYTTNDFAVAPEVGLKLTYAFSKNIIVSGGYNFLYLSRAIRPTEQLDQRVNTGLIPSDQDFVPGTTNPALPAFNRQSSDFWTHGITAGLIINF